MKNIHHLVDASKQGHPKASIRIVDSDVVVIGISMFEHIGLQELWIDFGTGKAHRHIPVYTIVQNLGSEYFCLATISFIHGVRYHIFVLGDW